MNSFIISGFLISLLNLVISFLFRKFRPKEINGFVGYRTPRSMRSQAAWDFANSYSGKLSWQCALGLFAFQFVLYPVFESEVALHIFLGTWIGCLLFIILRTEYVLKKKRF
jgi:uncharacterized membrane protein